MGLQQSTITSLPFVNAELNYLAPTPGKPRSAAGRAEITALPEPHTVPIFNARAAGREFSLDREGFALVAQHTEVGEFR